MHRRSAEAERDAGREAIGAVLTAGLALAQVGAIHDERIGVVEHTWITIGCGRRTVQEGTGGQQTAEALDLVAGEPRRTVHRRAVSQRLEPGELDEPAIVSHRLELIRVRQQLEPHVGEAAVQRLVVGLPDGGDDVGGLDRTAVEFEARRCADQIVTGIGPPLGEERLEVPGQFDGRCDPVTLTAGVPPAGRCIRQYRPRTRAGAARQTEHRTPQFQRQPRTKAVARSGSSTRSSIIALHDRLDVGIDPVRLRPQHGELGAQVAAELGAWPANQRLERDS